MYITLATYKLSIPIDFGNDLNIFILTVLSLTKMLSIVPNCSIYGLRSNAKLKFEQENDEFEKKKMPQYLLGN